MGEKIILPPEPPIQSLMNYVFDNYANFDDFCEFKEDLEPEPVNKKDCAKCHRESYFPQGKPKYQCNNFKRTYLIRYFARQFAQSDFLISCDTLTDIKSKPNLSAISLGGGPAPEAIALINGLSSFEGEYNLFFDNIDCEASWENIYYDICNQFLNYVKNIKLKIGFSCYDVTGYVSEKQYDVVFISWVLSEVGEQESSKILEVARNMATPQGYILVMDRYEPPFVSRISTLVNAAQGLTLVEHETKKYVHSVVDFPQDIMDTFTPDCGCDFAFWLLQNSPDDF